MIPRYVVKVLICLILFSQGNHASSKAILPTFSEDIIEEQVTTIKTWANHQDQDFFCFGLITENAIFEPGKFESMNGTVYNVDVLKS